MERGGAIPVDLHTNGGRTVGAEVLVLVPLREDEEEALPHRDRSPATGTKELGGFELIVIRLRGGAPAMGGLAAFHLPELISS